MATPARIRSETLTTAPAMSTVSSGRMASAKRFSVSKRRWTSAWMKSMSPTDATTWASTGAERSGRKMSTCASRAQTTALSTPSTSANSIDVGSDSLPSFSVPMGRTRLPSVRSAATR